MADQTAEEDRERLKSALWYAVGQIVDEESLKRNRNATPQFIGALTELVWTQVGAFSSLSDAVPLYLFGSKWKLHENVAIDLESFANHAARTTVTTDDVLLLARKNPDLQGIMQEFIDERKKEKGRKQTTATGGKKGAAASRLAGRR
ncbi:MHF histone-fold complex component [Lecanicillium sp. MT-2017a]|nr:MHF histone-fold complex component [Lecanicillium sp. MT-2017a]